MQCLVQENGNMFPQVSKWEGIYKYKHVEECTQTQLFLSQKGDAKKESLYSLFVHPSVSTHH